MKEIHNIDPVYNGESKILILGSFPSVKSREGMFFYNHPQNRFWKVLSTILGCPLPTTVEEKKIFLINNKIAVWDVIQSCSITNSSDSSIKNIKTNDISAITDIADIKRIFANGGKAYTVYKKYIGDDITLLPSTSPANAAYSFDKLVCEWSIIKDVLF